MTGFFFGLQIAPLRYETPPVYVGPTTPSVSFLPSGSPASHVVSDGSEVVYDLPTARFLPSVIHFPMNFSPPASLPSEYPYATFSRAPFRFTLSDSITG